MIPRKVRARTLPGYAMDTSREDDAIAIAGFVVDPLLRELRDVSGARVPLRPRSFAVLLHLARHANQVVTKDELMHLSWPHVVVTDDSLVQCIKDIRRALDDDAKCIVRTEPRRGYCLMVGPPAVQTPWRVPEEASFEQEIRFATASSGVRIAYAISGNGAPLVRAPHWLTHLDWDWRSAPLGPRIRAFSQHCRLLRYDERGQGLSDRDVAPGTLDECVGDMEAVVDAAGWQRFALFAASGGSPIAIRYAARHPERVTRLVLLGAYARGARVRGVSPKHLEAYERLLRDGWGEDNPAFRQMMTTQIWPAADAQQLQSFSHLQRVSCSAQNAAEQVRRRSEFNASGDLPLIHCPTLVLHSPRDAAVPFDEGRMIAATVVHARFEPFDSPNHTPLAGEPAFEHVHRLIDDFLHAEVEEDRRTARPALRAVGQGRDTA